MNTLFFLESNDDFIIDFKIKELINQFSIETSSIIKYNLKEVNINNLIDELNSFDIFDNKKIVIGYNTTFLSNEKDLVNHNISSLEKYIEHPNDNILLLISEKLDNRKKIVKLVQSKFNTINPFIDIKKIIKSKLSDYKINDNTINYLIDYLRGDNYLIVNNLEKLKTYKLNEKEINISDINTIIDKNIDDNIFHLIDNIINKNYTEVFSIYNKLIENNEEVTKIIVLIYKQIRKLYNIKVLSTYMNNIDIGLKIKLPPFIVGKLKEMGNSFSKDKLLDSISLLSTLDSSIKTGKLNNDLAFYMFVFSF